MRLFVSALTVVLGLLAGFQQSPPTLTFTPFRSSGIYESGERAGWTVTRAAGASVESATYTIRKNNLEVLKTGTLDLSNGSAVIETTLNEPSMLYVQVTAGSAKPIALGAAVTPTKLQPSAPRPADFDAFWDGKLKALAQVPMGTVLTAGPVSREGIESYTVKLNSLNSNVHGYLAKPARSGKFPALIIYQWAGVYALPVNAAADRAAEGWLAFNVSSHDMPPQDATGVARNYQTIGNTDRETSYFLNMYLRDVRAIDYIASRPDWDGKTLVVMGTSMGGQQSLAAAGLSSKVTALIVNEPAGADSNGDLHGRKAGYPNWPSTDPKVMQTALYFDTVNFASRIKASAVVSMGFIDTIAPPVGIWIALSQIPGYKEAIPMIESDHNNITPDKQGAYETRWREVLRTIQSGDPWPPPR